MPFVGMDVDVVRGISRDLAKQSHDLTGIVTTVDGLVRKAAGTWHGGSAEQFARLWRTRFKSDLQHLAQHVQELADSAGSNADSQDRVSSNLEGGSGSEVCTETVDPKLEAALTTALGGTPADRAAWWDSLSDSDRNALIQGDPESVLQLDCLTPEQRGLAVDSYLDDLASTTMVAQVKDSFEVEGSIHFVKIGVDGSATISAMADGSYDVVFEGGANVGLGVDGGAGSASVKLDGEASVTYHFANRAEADKFVNDLMTASVPKDLSDGAHAVTNPSGYVIDKYADVFRDYNGHLEKTELTGKLTGEAEVKVPGGGSAKISGSIGYTYDAKSGDHTYFMEYDGKLQDSTSHATGGGKVELQTDEHNNLKSLTIESKVGTGGNIGIPDGLPIKDELSASANLTATTAVDLSNPANRVLAADYVRAVSQGDASAAAAAEAQLRFNSTVTLRTDATEEGKFGFDVKVLKADVTEESTVASSVYVKPPGSDQYQDLLTNGTFR